MTPEEFLNSKLGWMSSHPLHQRKRRRWFEFLTLFLLLLTAAAGILGALTYDSWIDVIRGVRSWVLMLGCTLSLIVGMLVTLVLVARWAELQQRGKLAYEETSRETNIDRWVAVAAVAVGIVAPLLAMLLPSARGWQSIRFACHLFAVLPLVAILLGMWWLTGNSDDADTTKKRRPIWLLLALLAGALMLVTLGHDLGVVFDNSALDRLFAAMLPSWYKDAKYPFLGVLVLLPFCYAMLVIWRFFPATVPLEPSVEQETEDSENPGFFSRVFTFLKRLIFPVADEAAPSSDTPWPAWLDDLLDTLPVDCRCLNEPELLEHAETSAVSDSTELASLFGGLVPTVDQVRLFRRFCQSYEELVRHGAVSLSRRKREPSADLIVEGYPGSGRTTGLVACAIYAALGRGQRVLFLVANVRRQEITRQRIDETLQAFNLHYYVYTGVVSDQAVAGWLASGEEETCPVPHIMVGTLDAVEEYLYGASHLDSEKLARLRRLVLLPEVVVVDDFMDFDDAQRSHLPFVLDKQRLLLEGEFASLQTVVTCPRLADIGRTTFGTRLFTERLLQLDRNVISLRARKSGRAWRVNVETHNVAEAVDRMVVWCLKQGLDVVLYRRGIDENERCRQEANLCDEAGTTASLAVISDLDQPLGIAAHEVDAVFYQVAAHEDVCFALRMHMGNDDSVIFSVRPVAEVRDMPTSGIVPVVADRSALPLTVAHLRSAARFLNPGTPIPEAVWLQFGLSYRTLPAAHASRFPEFILRRDAWEEVDGEHSPLIWPYLSMYASGAALDGAVDTYSLADETLGLYRFREDSFIFMGRRHQAIARKEDCRAEWVTSAGQNLGRTSDLAHAREFRLVHGTEVFVPQANIRKVPNGYHFVTQHWRGNGQDAYLPVYEIEWETDDRMIATPMGGGSNYGIQWFYLDAPDGAPVTVDMSVRKLMTEYGVETPIRTLKCAFPARLSGALILPREIDSDTLEKEIAQGLAGPWASNPSSRFSVALTGAINSALQVRLPGLSFFAPSMTFWLAEDENPLGQAVTWFIEPTDGGRSVMPVLGQLLLNSEERASLFQWGGWFLKQLEMIDEKQRFVRRFARIGYAGDDAVDRIAEARNLFKRILETNTGSAPPST